MVDNLHIARRDATNVDTRASEAISRIESRIDKVEAEAREARTGLQLRIGRKRLNSLPISGMSPELYGRTEAILDHWTAAPSPPSPP